MAIKNITFLGCPVGSGQKLWGVEDGANDIRTNTSVFNDLKNKGYNIEDLGDIEGTIEKSLYEVIYDVSLEKIKNKNTFPFWFGGDHSQAMATVSALLAVNPNTKIFWIDAHADCNTPQTSPSGNWHGMPAAALLNLFDKSHLTGMDFMLQNLKKENIFLFGLRDIDPGEKYLLTENKINFITMDDVKTQGFDFCLQKALDFLGNNSPIHVSFDVDGLDPSIVPCTGTPVGNGISFENMLNMAIFLKEQKNISSLEIVEYNPSLAKTPKDLETSRKTISKFLTHFF